MTKKISVAIVLLCLTLSLVFTGCQNNVPEVEKDEKASIHGRIVDKSVEDMKVYKISLVNSEGWTSPLLSLTSDGDYRFNNLSAGSYVIAIYSPMAYEPLKTSLIDLKPGEDKEFNYTIVKDEPEVNPDIKPNEKPDTVVIEKDQTVHIRGIDVPVTVIDEKKIILSPLSPEAKENIISNLSRNKETQNSIRRALKELVSDEDIICAYKNTASFISILSDKFDYPKEIEPIMNRIGDYTRKLSMDMHSSNKNIPVTQGDLMYMQWLYDFYFVLAEIGEFDSNGMLLPTQKPIGELPVSTLVEIDDFAKVIRFASDIYEIEFNYNTSYDPSSEEVHLSDNADGFIFFANIMANSVNKAFDGTNAEIGKLWEAMAQYYYCYFLFNEHLPADYDTRHCELITEDARFIILVELLYGKFDSWNCVGILDKATADFLDSWGFDLNKINKMPTYEILNEIVRVSGAKAEGGKVPFYLPKSLFKPNTDLNVVQNKLNNLSDPETVRLRNIIFDHTEDSSFKSMLEELPKLRMSFADTRTWNFYIESLRKMFTKKIK